MTIVKLLWKTIILLVCSIIQVFGVLVEGMAKMLYTMAKLLKKAHDRVLDFSEPKKEEEKVHIDVAL